MNSRIFHLKINAANDREVKRQLNLSFVELSNRDLTPVSTGHMQISTL